jgi:alpha-tubulin suppressor-like RCC1 family protein
VHGGAMCWGRSDRGQVGSGAAVNQLSPYGVRGLPYVGVQSIALGGAHTCAMVDGGLRCWGVGASGQLGNGSMDDSTLPVQVDLGMF